MRVIYSHTDKPGGAELALPALAEELGAEVWIRGGGRIADVVEERGVAVTRLRRSIDSRSAGRRRVVRLVREMVQIQFEISRLLRAKRPSVVVCNGVQGLLHLGIPAALARVPVVAFARDLGDGGNRSRIEVRIYRALMRLTSAVVSNSALTRRSWRLPDDALIVPTAIPDRFFDTEQSGGGGRTVVMVGRISPWKGQREVLLAMNLLAEERPDLVFLLVGSELFSEGRNELPQPVGFEFRETGFVDDPEIVMSQSDVLIHASLTPEPFGQVVAQAAALGLPIVCAREGGQSEWLDDGESCLMIDPRDPRSIARGIKAVLDEPRAASARAERARDAAQRFREDSVYRDLKRLVSDIEKGPRARWTGNR